MSYQFDGGYQKVFLLFKYTWLKTSKLWNAVVSYYRNIYNHSKDI